jgi:DNA-binding NtrC family response regulator
MRILVVEDNETFRETVRDLLRDAGYEVRGARSVRKATKRLSKNDYDLVLTDIELGDASGFDVIQVANVRRPATKLVVMSGRAQLGEQALQSGAARFLEKPFSAQHLLDVIAELLNEAVPNTPTTVESDSADKDV